MGAPSAIRYPDDKYDRIWYPSTVSTGNGILITSDFNASDVSVSDAIDKPPTRLFLNAHKPLNSSGSLTLSSSITALFESAAFVAMYFAELSSTDTLTFGIFIDGKKVSDDITLTYARATESYAVLDPKSTVLSLEPTKGSTLPPISSAVEIFRVSPPLSNGTNSTDIEGLQAIVDQFKALEDWSGDPCLPKSFNWDWVECNSETNPRITALKLAGFELSGEFPDISSMNALVTIDLHNNNLSGVIPKFFGELPNLKELNLANNKFSGSIPASLSSNSKVNLNVTGNPALKCSGDSCTTSGNSGDRGSSSDGGNGSSSSRGSVLGGESRSSKAEKLSIGLVLAIVLPIFSFSLSFY